MEKRAILAAVLMFALLTVYQYVFAPAPEPPPPTPAPGAAQPPPKPVAAPPAGAPAASAPTVVPSPTAQPATPVSDRETRIETPLYRARVRSIGGDFSEWTIKFHGDKPLMKAGVLGPQGVVIERPGAARTPMSFTLSTESLVLGPERPEGVLEMTGEDGRGLRVVQRLKFTADSYTVERTIRVENHQSVPQAATISRLWATPVEWPKDEETFAGARPIHVVRLGGGYWPYRSALGSVVDFTGESRWIGFEMGLPAPGQSFVVMNGIFLSAMIPKAGGLQVVEKKVGLGKDAQG